MQPGKVIFLNGTSSSGKTCIAAALQNILDSYYLHTGIDHFLERVPKKFHVFSDGQNPSAAEGFLWVFPENDSRVSEIRVGPAGFRLLTGMYHAIAALAASGNDLIVDDVLRSKNVLRAAVDTLHTFEVLFVGVRCPLEIAEQREKERGDRNLGLVRAHYHQVHAHKIYDLEVDTSVLSAMQCANLIKERLQNGPAPDAFRRLRNLWEADP